MLLATVICSDPGCAEITEALVESLDDLEALVCECGFGVVVLGLAEARLSLDGRDLTSART